MKILKTIWFDDSGQDLAEYALIAALVSVVSIAALNTFGSSVTQIWNTLQEAVSKL